MNIFMSGFTIAQLIVPYACGGVISWFNGNYA